MNKAYFVMASMVFPANTSCGLWRS
jgi:hypothetical protein